MSANAGGGSGSKGSSQSNSSAKAATKRATAAETRIDNSSGSGEATQAHLFGNEDAPMDAQSPAAELSGGPGARILKKRMKDPPHRDVPSPRCLQNPPHRDGLRAA